MQSAQWNYYNTQELPVGTVDWSAAGEDFSTGWTFTLRMARTTSRGVTLMVKTTGITATAEGIVTVAWSVTDWNGGTNGDGGGLEASVTGTSYYVTLWARRTADSKDIEFNPSNPITLNLYATPGTVVAPGLVDPIYAASSVSFTPAGSISSVTVQAAIEEVATDAAADLAAHLADTVDAHDASAISLADAGNLYDADQAEEAFAELPARFAQAGTARGAVCFTFDDGYPSWASVIQPALNPGQRCTFFVTTNKIDAALGVTTATLTALAAAGHEFGAHSTTHSSYTSLTASQRATDHDTSVSTLEAFVGSGNVKAFAYPSGARNSTTDIECLWRYDRIFGIGNNGARPSTMDLPGQFLYGRTSWTQSTHDEVLDLIRRARSQPITPIIYCHDPSNTTGSFANDPTEVQVQEAFDLCQSLGVPMVPTRDSVNSAPYGMTNGGFENGLAGWTVTNSAAYTVEVVTDTPLDGLPGTKSLHVVTTGATTCFLEQFIPVIPGQPFNFSYRYRNISGATGHAQAVREYDYTGTQTALTTSGAQTAATWTLSNRDLTLAATTVVVGIRLQNNGGAAEFYIDHVHAGYQAWGKFG